MGIKKLFDSNKPQAILKSTNLEEEVIKNAPELESADNVREQIERTNRFIPQVDFDDPNNFVTYGSAQSYYEDAISRIYNKFPYDGSQEEITAFHNESTYLDLYLFDKLYPRTTGYIKIGTGQTFDSDPATNSELLSWGVVDSGEEYIKIFGGPHTASGGMPTGKLHTTFTGSNIYDTDIYGTDGTLALGRAGTRESNLRFDLSKGVTTEFWLKKEGFSVADTCKEVILDLWNGAASSSAGYGRFLLYITGSGITETGLNPLRLHMASGSNVADINLLSSAYTTASIGDSAWHHYAVSVESGSSAITTKAYVDGALNNTTTSTINFGQVTGSLIAYIGALQTSPSGNTFHGTSKAGDAPLSASMDEFRYWKSKRDEKDIQHNWWTQVRGGTNNEIANAELGVYYKFNEGITGTDSTDSTVLDYSGRISNGNWVGYPGSTARNVGSAIDSSTAVVSGTTEYKDPIIYSSHPDVLSHYNTYSVTGSVYDNQSNSSLLDSIPNWIVEQDELEGGLEAKKLTQIIGSYFDTLNLQVKSLNTLKDDTYLSSSHKPTPFARNLLSSKGLATPEIFVDADLLERFANRRSDRDYDLDLNEVKNLIYQNIYNNLIYIYKSKGTEKAFRNLIRCYGIGDEVVKFNTYGNNTEFKFENTSYSTTVRKNYVDFNHTDRFVGTVYQSSSATNTETTAITYVSGTSQYLANTAEIEVVFPRRIGFTEPGHFTVSFQSSSIFGCHEAQSDSSDFDWKAAASDNNFQMYAVRTDLASKDAYFLLKSRLGGTALTSSVYSNVYDNQKWNFAVRLKNKYWPAAPGITGSDGTGNVELDWYGVNVEYGVVKNSFSLTSGSLGNAFLTSPRRYYIGADRTNYSGSTVTKTDVKISSLRHWTTYLTDGEVRHHALDPDNIGTLNPSRNQFFTVDSSTTGVDNQTIPRIASLALHWDFSQVTGSDSSGAFTVEDASSGSVSLQGRYSNDGNVSHIIANQYAGTAYFPNATSTTGVISKEYLSSNKQRLPEVVNTDDSVNVLTRDEELYSRDSTISKMYFTFEKSMYGIVSQEMINYFGTIVEFNNLIGDITNKYRGEYKGLRLLRQLFFEKIQNSPDLDKFIDYYKWIDSSLIIFLQQLVPASAHTSDEVRVMVEDHILGRSKYRHQYPHLDYKGNMRWGGDDDQLQARVHGINELFYNWQFGHAPLNNSEATSALWWKERAKRSNSNFTTSALIDSARQSINDIILSFNSASAEKFNTGAGPTGVYEGSAYATRRFATPLKVSADVSTQIGAGYNYPRNHKPDAVYSITKRGSTTTRYDISKGNFKDIDVAEAGPPIIQTKRKFDAPLVTDNLDSTSYKSNKINAPTIIYSSSAGTTGYRSSTSGLEYAGYHNDSYGDDYDVPMQGPFTNQHVGGNRHRHVDVTIDPSLTSSANRPEAWNFASDIFRSNDSSFTRPSTSPQYRRDQVAKRPINIKNIQHRTGSHTIAMGNFGKRYEVVQTSDRRTNNSEFVKREGFSTASVTTDLLGYVGGLVDYAKPTRTRREHVIVERFSAPGGPEVAGDTIGGAGLDYESGQYSPYNNLNYRNTTVRQPLQTLLTERSEQFGLRSGSAVSPTDYTSVTASFHKVNRNALKRIEYSNQYVGNLGTVTTASTYDNYYVQHMIPRSDYQYAWITASYISSNTNVYGYFPYDGFVSTSAGLVGAISFVSASHGGTGMLSGKRQVLGAASIDHRTDFAGMNTTIVEPISASEFTLGYPAGTDNRHYYNYSDIGSFALGVDDYDSFINRLPNTIVGAYATSQIFLHRYGPYGHPTWKQIRVGQTQLARYYRKNNIYTHTPAGSRTAFITSPGASTKAYPRFAPSMLITQSVVVSAYKPLRYALSTTMGANASGQPIIGRSLLQIGFGNNQVTFEDTAFAEALGIESDTGLATYKNLLKIYKEIDHSDPMRAIRSIDSITYTETVYPSRANMYMSKIRGRNLYENNFWRDARADRTTKGASKKPTNSALVPVTQSSWALDAPVNFVSRTGFSNFAAGIAVDISTGHKSGELQNEYVHVHDGDVDELRYGPLYARKHTFSATQSVCPAWGILPPLSSAAGRTECGGTITTPNFPSADPELLSGSALYRGEALWEANTQAGYLGFDGSLTPSYTASARNPFQDTYSDFFEADLRWIGKDYSIVPEFRISEHLSYFQNTGGSLADKLDIFEIPGSPAASTVPQHSNEDNFYTVFTNSDFLRYFDIIKTDHEDLASPDSIQLRCKALKKFIPYDGFYPAERTAQIAGKFIQATSGGVAVHTGSGVRSGSFAIPAITPTVAGVPIARPLYDAMVSPGILFNTIKSGVAVDYPVLTGSGFHARVQYTPESAVITDATELLRLKEASRGIFSSTHVTSITAITASDQYAGPPTHQYRVDHYEGADRRIPFEALLEPEKYLAGIVISDSEPNVYAAIGTKINWQPAAGNLAVLEQYKLMMHNFLAESTNFFIKDGLTTIQSAKQQNFGSVTPGVPYGMRVKMYRSMDYPKRSTGSWGEFVLPQNTRDLVGVAAIDHRTGRSATPGTDVTAKETLTMYSRPSAFGPPLGLATSATSSWSGSMHDFAPQNGVYSAYTPPYYDGECWYDIIFWPRGLRTSNQGAQAYSGPHYFEYDPEESGTPYIPTLSEIFAEPHPNLFYASGAAVSLPLAGTFKRKWRFDQEELLRDSNSTYHMIHSTGPNPSVGPAAGPYINEWSMQLDASLNIFGVSDTVAVTFGEGTAAAHDQAVTAAESKWTVQTKFETPILNFNHVSVANEKLTTTDDIYANTTIPRGMWHQFGRLPLGDEGVYIQVTDIPKDWLNLHPSASLKPDMMGKFGSKNKSPYVHIEDDVKTYYNKYGVYASSGSREFAAATEVRSLVDICGFDTTPKKIGGVKDTHTIFEAVVAVPFTVVDGKRKFFDMISPTVDSAIEIGSLLYREKLAEAQVAGKQILRLEKMMKKYVFPPSFDFVNNLAVPSAVAMYVFEFSEELTKNDLVHIWQNLPPKFNIKMSVASAKISHKLVMNEMLASVGGAEGYDSLVGTPGWKETLRTTPSDPALSEMRWMIFKVKQRAKNDYYAMTVANIGEMTLATQQYTPNWPYDFCSIVEMAKLDVSVNFDNTPGTGPDPTRAGTRGRPGGAANEEPPIGEARDREDVEDHWVDEEYVISDVVVDATIPEKD